MAEPFLFPRGWLLSSSSYTETFLQKSFSRITNRVGSKPFRDRETNSFYSVERFLFPCFLLFSLSFFFSLCLGNIFCFLKTVSWAWVFLKHLFFFIRCRYNVHSWVGDWNIPLTFPGIWEIQKNLCLVSEAFTSHCDKLSIKAFGHYFHFSIREKSAGVGI